MRNPARLAIRSTAAGVKHHHTVVSVATISRYLAARPELEPTAFRAARCTNMFLSIKKNMWMSLLNTGSLTLRYG